MRVRNLVLLAKLLKDWKSALSNMSVADAVAPLHCLSRYMMTLVVSSPAPELVALGRVTRNLQLIRMVHLRPIRVTSVVPWAILLMESVTPPPVAMTASLRSRSKNFSSMPRPVGGKRP